MLGCSPPDKSSPKIEEALLENQVEELTKKLGRVERQLADQLKKVESDLEEKRAAEEPKRRPIEISEDNIVVTLYRFELASAEFSEVLDAGPVSEIFQRLEEKNAARLPDLTGILSPARVGDKHEFPAVSITDSTHFEYPIEYRAEADPENPTLVATKWSDLPLGFSLEGELLERQGDRFLFAVDYRETMRLDNEGYRLPTLFEKKPPGEIEMPVIHQAGLEVNAVVQLDVPTFLGTVVIPKKNRDQPAQHVYAVFLKVGEVVK